MEDSYAFSVDFSKVNRSSILRDVEQFHKAPAAGKPKQSTREALLRLVYFLQTSDLTSLLDRDIEDLFFGLAGLLNGTDNLTISFALLALERIAPLLSDGAGIMVVNSLQKIGFGAHVTVPDVLRVLVRVTDRDSRVEGVKELVAPLLRDPKAPGRLVAAASTTATAVLEHGLPLSALLDGTLASRSDEAAYQMLGLAAKEEASDSTRLTRRVLAAAGVDRKGRGRPSNGFTSVLACSLAGEILLNEGRRVDPLVRLLVGALEGASAEPGLAVAFEALRALVRLPASFLSSNDVKHCTVAFGALLSGRGSSVLAKAATLRVLRDAVGLHPSIATGLTGDLQALSRHRSHSIATHALSVLLSVGDVSDDFFDRLAPMLQTLPDHLRTGVIGSLSAYMDRAPQNARLLLPVLALQLREEGSADLKGTVLDAVVRIARGFDEVLRAKAVSVLAELLEDCEHVSLSTRVAGIMAALAPSLKATERRLVVRALHNRQLLENAVTRASSAAALRAIAENDVTLAPLIDSLLGGAEQDSDDAVRARAAAQHVTHTLDVAPLAAEAFEDISATSPIDLDGLPSLLLSPLGTASNEPMVMPCGKPGTTAAPDEPVESPVETPETVEFSPFDKAVAAALEGSDLGAAVQARSGLVGSSEHVTALTEAGLELGVAVRRHLVGDSSILLEFTITSLEDVGYRDLSVELSEAADWVLVASQRCPAIAGKASGTAYALVEATAELGPGAVGGPLPVFGAELRFTTATLDPTSADGLLDVSYDGMGMSDSIAIDPIAISHSSFMVAVEAAGERGQEDSREFVLPTTTEDAIVRLPPMLGLRAVEASAHSVTMAAKYRNKEDVVAVASFTEVPDGVEMKLSVYADSQSLRAAVFECIM